MSRCKKLSHTIWYCHYHIVWTPKYPALSEARLELTDQGMVRYALKTAYRDGLDGVAAEKHGVDAIALEDSEVCILPYTDLERIARDFPPLQHQLHRVMSRELIRENGVMLLLGSMKADQ